ncbi:hypothetical protein OOT00_15040 [Desulfobotulus sp. H1]|uniref:AAA family ATPase n=1 Tax=Desulfobotulus pelophilus TaxID=2823377 RepID=A0ABT3NCW0_9BACT|nr:hypothetical protein [Desulfobotulus pelophilus]MCW7755300.1 hypothetical protein [Desulfobotulus pelophilus]
MQKEPVDIHIKELDDILDHYLDAAGRLNYAIKIVGHPGIGKSSVVRQAAERKNFLFIDTRLAFKENIDLGGYPVPDHENQRMIYFRPRFIPPERVPEEHEGILWFLDEANRAHPTVIQTLFQIITEGRCGEHLLPDRTAIVLAGNLGEEDSTTITDFDDAALDGRLALFHLKPRAIDWLRWAAAREVHPAILRYISLFPEKLWDEHRIHPNPRGWHQVSQALITAYGIKSEKDLANRLRETERNSLEKLMISLIGDLACFDFIRQLTHPRQISTSDILTGNRGKLESARKEEILTEDLLWAMTGAISHLREQLMAQQGIPGKEDLIQLGHLLCFIATCRSDSRIAFCHLLIRECGLLTLVPGALTSIRPEGEAEKIRLSIEALLS